MPPLTKVQKRLVDRVQDEDCVIILSRWTRNPYLYTYYKGEKPTISKVSSKAFCPLFDSNVFYSVQDTVLAEEQVEIAFSYNSLRDYLEKPADTV